MARLGDVVTVVVSDGKGHQTERHALVSAVWGSSSRQLISALSVEDVASAMWRGEKVHLGRSCSFHQVPLEQFASEKDKVWWKPGPPQAPASLTEALNSGTGTYHP